MAASLSFLYGQAVPQCTHHIDKRFDGYFTLQYMAAGQVCLKIDSKGHQLTGRWFWSCHPGPHVTFHARPPSRSWNHRYIAFQGPAVESWASEGLYPIAPQRPPHGVDYALRFDEMLSLSRRGDPWGTRRAVHLLEGILIELAEARARSQVDPLVERAIGLLHDADYRMEEQALAAELGVSDRTLRRRLLAATGLSPRKYVLQHRIEAARTLLAETRLPIKEIARQLHYRDVFFFTRQFTSVAGVPPGRYRQSAAG